MASTSLAAGDGFMIGGGVESDALKTGSACVGDRRCRGSQRDTWLSAGLAKSTVDLGRGLDLESVFADIELDHYFDPVGVRIGASYWGDSDILDSQ